jgi:hypothetical protein
MAIAIHWKCEMNLSAMSAYASSSRASSTAICSIHWQ